MEDRTDGAVPSGDEEACAHTSVPSVDEAGGADAKTAAATSVVRGGHSSDADVAGIAGAYYLGVVCDGEAGPGSAGGGLHIDPEEVAEAGSGKGADAVGLAHAGASAFAVGGRACDAAPAARLAMAGLRRAGDGGEEAAAVSQAGAEVDHGFTGEVFDVELPDMVRFTYELRFH